MTRTQQPPSQNLTLISHVLCPYVQRAIITLEEKQVSFARIDIDLANKPAWFTALSPLGRVPVLRVGDVAIFESAVIVEYLEETVAPPLHPAAALARAEHRSWIEFASTMLADVGRFYSAGDAAGLAGGAATLNGKFDLLEARLGAGRYFAGDRISLVDAAFAPLFRYFDVFDEIGDFGFMRSTPKLSAWRERLAARPSVIGAVSSDYPAQLRAFLLRRNNHLAALMGLVKSPSPTLR